MELKHGEKIVDGLLVKYLCQPCPECKAKIEAAKEIAEEMAKTLLLMHQSREGRK